MYVKIVNFFIMSSNCFTRPAPQIMVASTENVGNVSNVKSNFSVQNLISRFKKG